eukprot:366491-Chlamydomonas_euryale.AAC.8
MCRVGVAIACGGCVWQRGCCGGRGVVAVEDGSGVWRLDLATGNGRRDWRWGDGDRSPPVGSVMCARLACFPSQVSPAATTAGVTAATAGVTVPQAVSVPLSTRDSFRCRAPLPSLLGAVAVPAGRRRSPCWAPSPSLTTWNQPST